MHLFKNVRIHQIFGANTDVGKTIFGTALALASASKGKQVRYLKPVSTGRLQDADDEFVGCYTTRFADRVRQDCIFRFNEPVSPHLALKLEIGQDKEKALEFSDSRTNASVSRYINCHAANVIENTDIYVETAGGVHSPTLNGTSQADAYRPLRLPVVLVGDSKLGGISSTISSYESLLIRGYDIDCVLVFKDEYYRNWEYLTEYFKERRIRVHSFASPPARLDDPSADKRETEAYFSKLLDSHSINALDEDLQGSHKRRIEELESMPSRVSKSVWWPFVQHKNVKEHKDITVIDSATGDFFSTYLSDANENSNRLSPLYDGSASWWTQTFGHGHPSLALAAAKAAGRYGHVMFPQAVHAPVLRVAESMLSENGPGNGWASRVFFTDNGSCAMEVALKMAIRAYVVRNQASLDDRAKSELGILGLKGSYHGDTIGAMNACSAGDGVYTCEWHSARGFWLDSPTVGIKNGKATVSVPTSIAKLEFFHQTDLELTSVPQMYDVESRLDSTLAKTYRRYILGVLHNLAESKQHLSALVLEPLVLGAGGMIFVDPLFQRVLIDVVRAADSNIDDSWRGLPVIFDEVFTGMYRLGHQTCSSVLGVKPDIACYAKTLTGGVVPLAVTLTSKSIFEAFWSDSKGAALLHGHSYTAHAIGCEVINETMKMMEKEVNSPTWTSMRKKWSPSSQGEASSPSPSAWSLWSPDFVNELSCMDDIESSMALGTVLAFKPKGQAGGYVSHLAQSRLSGLRDKGEEPFGVHFRTLGDVAYFMTSLNTPLDVVRGLERRILKTLR